MSKLLKLAFGFSFCAVVSISHADMAKMNQYYNNPKSAPKVKMCKGNQNCNAFYALSRQWKSIPNNYRVPGCSDCKIKDEARDGNGYGLYKGYSLSQDRAITLSDAGENRFYRGGAASPAEERIFAEGRAVLIYLDNKKK
ncbi:hypothetical protein [Psychrobacter ciconiae]|uniref:hypothetical protein n=1 Tax=Psychrobacter ciconiae TaxID=1553449 RepID=UPI00191940A3|nr:hypothetical protein [Psychrobacter ciconiae]